MKVRLATLPHFIAGCLIGALAADLVVAAPQDVHLSNRHLRIVLDATAGDLVALREPHDRSSFSLGANRTNGLWRLEIVSPQPQTILPSDAKVFRVSYTNGRAGVLLVWDDFGLEDAPNLRVEATLRLDTREPVSRWRIGLSRLGNLHPAKLAFPRLAEIPQAAAERVAVPLWMGQETTEIRDKLAAQKVDWLRAHFERVHPGDYVALLAYLEMNAAHEKLLQELRLALRDAKKVATSLGFGPRFLHSTGQLHKGGADNGVFIQISADPAGDLQIPDEGLTFGILERAQSLGDLDALQARGRRLLRIHLQHPAQLRELVDGLA